MLLFLPVWLAGWVFGEAAALATLVGRRGPGSAPDLLLVFWLLAWSVAGVLVVAAFLWNAFGRETVEISGRTLRVSRRALGLGRTREYDGAQVRELRVLAPPPGPPAQPEGMRHAGFGGGAVAFEYGTRTVRVLGGLDEEEAARVGEELRGRLGLA